MIKSGNNPISIIPPALKQLILGRNSFASPKQKKTSSPDLKSLGIGGPRLLAHDNQDVEVRSPEDHGQKIYEQQERNITGKPTSPSLMQQTSP
jgi:hypothetical protein